MRPVAVVLGVEAGGLAVVRALAEKGVRVWAADFYPSAPGLHSRRVARRVITPDPTTAPERCAAFFREQFLSSSPAPVLIPANDPYVIALARCGELPGAGSRLPIAPPAVLDQIMDKRRQYRVARESGIAMPGTWWLDDADLGRRGAEIPYPCVLKPAFSHPFVTRFGVKAVTVDSPRGLRDTCREFRERGHPLLVQEIIPGGPEALFEANVFVRRDGTPWAAVTARKREQHPRDFGSGTIFESVDAPELLPLVSTVVKALGYRGLCNIEFKRDARDGEFKFLELNPRASSCSALPTACGVNLPWLLYLEATGEPLPAPQLAPGVRKIWVYPEVRLQAMGRLAMPSWAPRTWPWAPGYVQALASVRDPRPQLVFLVRMVVHWLRRLRRSPRARAQGTGAWPRTRRSGRRRGRSPPVPADDDQRDADHDAEALLPPDPGGGSDPQPVGEDRYHGHQDTKDHDDPAQRLSFHDWPPLV